MFHSRGAAGRDRRDPARSVGIARDRFHVGGRRLALSAIGLGLIVGLACTPQKMTDQPRQDTYSGSDFFANEAAARMPVENSVARGSIKDDPHLYTGQVDGVNVNTFPEPVTREMLDRGRDRFNIFCAPCHGEVGAGGGLVAQRGYPGVRGLHDDRLRNVEVGYLFQVVSNGFNRMPPYGHLMSAEDRWAVVAYVRALQLSQNARIDDVPAEEQERLRSQ
ncbi:MAG TPA: cytochrome c [Dehalococcoidia bacterium]|nr:cytochrome c [Dehalococcoidia bacterium]